MEIAESKQKDIAIYRISGRLDSNSSMEFEETVFQGIENGVKNIMMDFAELEYISSAGLRVILKAAKDLKRQAGRLVLCNLQDYVKEVFEISGFDTFLPIAPSPAEGMKVFDG